jgi:FMN-dependent NADH-azoreductase
MDMIETFIKYYKERDPEQFLFYLKLANQIRPDEITYYDQIIQLFQERKNLSQVSKWKLRRSTITDFNDKEVWYASGAD